MKNKKSKQYKKFADFYPYYLEEHQDKYTKLLHFIGTALYLIFLVSFLQTYQPTFLLLCVVSGYGFAWLSHLGIEKNKPATFQYPIYSLMADHVMFYEILRGRHQIL
jgi:hypothetical protein